MPPFRILYNPFGIEEQIMVVADNPREEINTPSSLSTGFQRCVRMPDQPRVGEP